MKRLKVAVLGVTGAVGQEFLELLKERKFPIQELRLLASSRSAGKKIEFMGKSYQVEEASLILLKGDLVLKRRRDISRELAPHIVSPALMVRQQPARFRMDPEIPLVVPEINPEISPSKRHYREPELLDIIMLVPLFSIHKTAKIKRIIVATISSQAAPAQGPWKNLKRKPGFSGRPPVKKQVLPQPNRI